MVIKIDHKLCDGNGECIKICPVNVIELKNKKCTVVRPKDCIDCGACVSVCPNEAISM